MGRGKDGRVSVLRYAEVGQLHFRTLLPLHAGTQRGMMHRLCCVLSELKYANGCQKKKRTTRLYEWMVKIRMLQADHVSLWKIDSLECIFKQLFYGQNHKMALMNESDATVTISAN